MKALALSLLLSLGVAAPALADPAKPAVPAAHPADAEPAAEPALADPDALIDDATTPEARRRLMMRCAGPPAPRDPAEVAATLKKAETKLAAISEAPASN